MWCILTLACRWTRISFGRYLTIDELFTFTQSAIDEEAIKIVSEYDLEYGFPTKVWIDWNEMIVDEERGFQVSNLVEVEFEAN